MKKLYFLVLVILLVACAGAEGGADSNIIFKVYQGQLIQFFSPHHTYVIGTERSDEINNPLLDELGDEPEWSLDGQWVALVDTISSSNKPKLYLMSWDGKIRIHIMVHPKGVYEPTWSPDGSSLAYFAYDDSQTGIYILNIECFKTQMDCVPEPAFVTRGRSPDWSPDGTQIAYEGLSFGIETLDEGVFVMSIDGSREPVNLTTSLGQCTDPDWSPDGAKIVLSCNNDIYVMSSNGSGIENLTQDNGGGTKPMWSRDGSKVFFVSERDGLGKHIGFGSAVIYSNALFMMGRDGKDILRLSPNDNEEILWYSLLP